jgi:hypothetical protein
MFIIVERAYPLPLVNYVIKTFSDMHETSHILRQNKKLSLKIFFIYLDIINYGLAESTEVTSQACVYKVPPLDLVG